MKLKNLIKELNKNPCKEISLGQSQPSKMKMVDTKARGLAQMQQHVHENVYEDVYENAIKSLFKYKKGEYVLYDLVESTEHRAIRIKCVVEGVSFNLQGEPEYVLVNKDYKPGPWKFKVSQSNIIPIKHNRRKLNI